MKNRIILFLSYLFIAIITQSCENDDWNFDIPGCMNQSATNYDSSANIDNGSCYFGSEIFIYDIDASSYNEWVYFSFSLGTIINILDSENSLEWDVAFKRNHIKTNGGLSGVGSVCAIVDDSQTWTNDSFNAGGQISNGACQEDEMIEGSLFTYQGCYDPQTHMFSDCIKNPALDNWGHFDDSYHFNVSNYQLFVKGLDGSYFKFWAMSYYDDNGESGKIKMAYQPISD